METKFEFPTTLRNASFALIAVGVVAYAIGFVATPERAWASFLLDNIYFLGLAMGASFYSALQYITQSGWSAQYKRIPEAMGTYLPYAFVGFAILVAFGTHSIFHWSHEHAVEHDALLQHKAPFLNTTFLGIRVAVSFALWIFMTRLLRNWSLKEDLEGGLEYFRKSEFYSRVFIFIIAFTFSFFAWDWMMSIDAHWFSTIYAAKNLVSAILHGICFMVLVIIIMRNKGYFPTTNTIHLHDYSRYMFAFSIIYGYFWFSQFFLIWFANIPEETIYYVERLEDWSPLMLINFAINFFFPFLFLLWNRIAKTERGLVIAASIMMVGYAIDLYEQIMPGISKLYKPEDNANIGDIGFLEIGGFLGFAGLFLFVFMKAFTKSNIIPVNHPYLQESLEHDGQ